MSTAHTILIDDAVAMLRRQTESLAGSGTVEEVFAVWLLPPHADVQLDASAAAQRARGQTGSTRQYRDVAVLGFASAAGISVDENKPALEAGIKWLVGRTPFAPDSVPSFEVDAIALLGIAMSIPCLGEAVAGPARQWLDGVISKSLSLPRMDPFDRLCLEAGRLTLLNAAGPAPDTDAPTADVRTALRSKGVQFTVPNETDDEVNVLMRLREPQPVPPLPFRAAVLLAATMWIRRRLPTVQLQRATTDDVVQLLNRVEASMRRWTWESQPRTAGASSVPIRWHIENEYHVQNLLWAILSAVFSDLEDEENLPSFGQKHPRFDLGIPSLRTVIEVKFVRSGQPSAFAKIIGEAAEDASLYRSSNASYDKLVLFVWDDSRSSEQHAELIQGLQKIDGIVGAVVVSRPGSMSHSNEAPSGTAVRRSRNHASSSRSV